MPGEIYGNIDGESVLKGHFRIAADGEEEFCYSSDWKQAMRMFQVRQRIVKARVPLSFLTRTLDNYQGEDKPGNIKLLRRLIDGIPGEYSSAHTYLWSRLNSTQKTTTAKTLIKELILKDVSCFFTTMGELVDHLKNVDYKENSESFIEHCATVNFLVIDDAFDIQKVVIYKSGYQLKFLDIFLRNRLETQNLATCFTSNVPVSEITSEFGASLQALIARSVKEFEFNDRVFPVDLSRLWEQN
jgi:hypothetical protein